MQRCLPSLYAIDVLPHISAAIGCSTREDHMLVYAVQLPHCVLMLLACYDQVAAMLSSLQNPRVGRALLPRCLKQDVPCAAPV